MATKYSDIIKLRGGKAAYNIEEEKAGEWTTFIPNEQFNGVLSTVLKSVRGNDIDNHKSFWINGTYGTGKSHAVAVISHLLGDPIDSVRDYLDYEYKDPKFAQLRQSICSLRNSKRLFTVKLYGLASMAHVHDLALVVQRAVTDQLQKQGIHITAKTDFQTTIDHINANPGGMWDGFIQTYTQLSSIVEDRQQLVANLEAFDISTYNRVQEVCRISKTHLALQNDTLAQWLMEVQEELRSNSDYNGLLLVWDEFTDVMNDAIGIAVLKELQLVAEKFMNTDNDTYLFLISHPSAFDKISPDEVKQTDGRYHRMKYNMESVSAFKIMSRKFEVVDPDTYNLRREFFFSVNNGLLDLFSAASANQAETKDDLQNLFPLHPGTANLATHYATVVGSSSRSVFEFLGQNDAIRAFLDDEAIYANRTTITADYLWDYVLKVFIDDTQQYGAVTERFNTYRLQVEHEGPAYNAVFKGILLLNAFNNVSGENNQGLITPTKDNIVSLFAGTQYEPEVDAVLNWLNEQGIVQRAPGDVYSVQFSALPSMEIEEKKQELRTTQFRFTSQILKFAFEEVKKLVDKRLIQSPNRPFTFDIFSDENNDAVLRNKIKNGKKAAHPYELFVAMLFARNNTELAQLKEFADKLTQDAGEEKELRDIILIVFDDTFGEKNYERFIEYQANYSCAQSHGFIDQVNVHRSHAIDLVKEWLGAAQRGNATIYFNEENQALSVKHLTSALNNGVAPAIFPYGPDACQNLCERAPKTFWKPLVSKEIARAFLFKTTRTELLELNGVMKPIQYLIQDCLDENLQWKDDVPADHPFKAVCDFVANKIKYADKTLPFNLSEKLIDLTRSPYGLYGNYAAIAMIAFALRPYINKIFDQMGKPRDANNLVEDVTELIKAWESGKTSSKLNFKFQTPEEGKLCKSLVQLFSLKNAASGYTDISSLKDARFAITGVFLEQKGYPLWSLKYVPDTFLATLPFRLEVTEDMKKLFDNIASICAEREQRNVARVKDTLALIDSLHLDVANLLKTDGAFGAGFEAFLLQDENVHLAPAEVTEAYDYIRKHLESTVGYWTEAEVINTLKNWKLSKLQTQPTLPPTDSGDTPSPTPQTPLTPNPQLATPHQLTDLRSKAKKKVAALTPDAAKALLAALCEEVDESILNAILNRQ